MYVDVKIGKRGEIVIPAFIRKKLKIKPGENIMMYENENRIELVPKKKDVVKEMLEHAEKAGLKEKNLVYGDRLYEEIFG